MSRGIALARISHAARGGVFVVALVAALLLGSPSPAHAGVLTAWGSIQPTGNVGTNIPIIIKGSGPYNGYPLVPASLKLYIDDGLVPRGLYTGTVSTSSIYVYYNPVTKLVDGPHTFRVEVSDTTGRLSSYQWGANVVQPPTAVWVAPVAGSTSFTGRPPITMSLDDNTPGTTFAVAGQAHAGSATGPVTATFEGAGLPAGQNSFALSSELAPGIYYLTATVTDAAGNLRTLQGTAARVFSAQSVPAMSVLESCDGCHPTLRAAHPTPAATDCAVCHAGYDGDHMEGTDYCEDCHWDGWHTGGAGAVVAVRSSCVSCHTVGRPGIAQHTDASTAEAHVSAADECVACHLSSLTVQHATTPDGSAYALQCDLCHASADARVIAAIAGADASCAACHDGGHIALHDVTIAESCADEGCHSGTNLTTLHSGTCASCHESPDSVVTDAIANQQKDCAVCHANADHESLHVVTVAEDCAGCHVGTSLTSVHTVTQCGGCHESADLTVQNAITTGQRACSACHAQQPHEGIDALHAGTVTSGPVNVFDYHEGYSPLVWNVPCALCHASVNLLEAHGGSCAACHNGSKPADSFTTWNKGCQQGACHVVIDHPSADPAHNSFDCEAACHEPNWDVYYGSCDWCHDPSTAAPTTSSNVKATYVGSATITMSAPGISWTFYKLDGGPRIAGSSLMVPGPESGTEVHTLEYWSVDDAGNEELPHKSATFTITADITPPTTTSNAQPSYLGPATITLTVSDDGSSPVQGTYWRLDEGDEMTGRTVLVPQPASGEQAYTLEFWSVDASGNEELPHKTVSFTITADNTPPTGSIVINGGADYTISQSVSLSLSASDPGGSGVSQMRFSNDNVNWSAWQSYATMRGHVLLAGNGTKTVWVQYRDVAGNVGTYSDDIIFDNVAPTGSISINGGAASTDTRVVTLSLSATDGLSGLSDMRFSNNGSTWSAWEAYATSKEWTLAAGAGTRYAYVQFRDVAGNVRTYSETITLTATDTIAPTGSIAINGGDSSTATTDVTLTLSASDTGGSGVSQMQFSNDNTNWSAWETYATSRSWTLIAGAGTRTVYARYRDGAGNVSATYSDTITLTNGDGSATLAFVWHPGGWGEAHLRVQDAGGAQIVDTWVSGTGADLDLYVTVESGQDYYMECIYYYDEDYDEGGGPYGKWTSDTSINPDGILSPGETVTWFY